ncbi:MAG: thioredoxin [Rhodospirillaceae bacterium]|nr:thioredoxin [Rhodospirillaceae bacterium]|tara:strand:+ start:4038 stop:4955 length:918 start_codon:yes stop_codon:yes gene_type:complete
MESIIGQAGNSGEQNLDLVKESSTANFADDVIQASAELPVLVDFWAPWCGPCKQLTPVLEKLVRAASGKIRLVKINIDENQELATQLQVQSIPMVYAFKDGQPVDGFMGALPESQIRDFIEKLIGPVGPSPSEEVMNMAKEAFSQEDFKTAANLFSQVMQNNPGEAAAIAGLTKCYIGMGEADQAREIIDSLDEETSSHPEVSSAIAALNLKEQSSNNNDDVSKLEKDLTDDPNNHQARYDLATALSSSGSHEAAIDHLVEIIKHNRKWNEDQAREQLLKIFEALGPTDPITVAGRRKLSTVLFS